MVAPEMFDPHQWAVGKEVEWDARVVQVLYCPGGGCTFWLVDGAHDGRPLAPIKGWMPPVNMRGMVSEGRGTGAGGCCGLRR